MKTTFKQTPRNTIESNVIKDDKKRKQITERVNKLVNKNKKSQASAVPTKFSYSVGKEVSALRDSLGMNIRDFSKKVDISFPNLCYIEQGKAACKISTLERIAEAAGKTIEIKFV